MQVIICILSALLFCCYFDEIYSKISTKLYWNKNKTNFNEALAKTVNSLYDKVQDLIVWTNYEETGLSFQKEDEDLMFSVIIDKNVTAECYYKNEGRVFGNFDKDKEKLLELADKVSWYRYHKSLEDLRKEETEELIEMTKDGKGE